MEVNGVEVGQVTTIGPGPRFQTYRFMVPARALSQSATTVVRFATSAAPAAEWDPPKSGLAVRTLELRALP